MQTLFNVGDLVIEKEIGSQCMKIIKIDFDFDEIANGHFTRTILNSISNTTSDTSGEQFDEENHKIYFAICQWNDENNNTHSKKTRLNDLTFCPEPYRFKEVKGFNREE